MCRARSSLGLRVEVVFLADAPERRQHRKLRPEALHPPAFVVDGDQQGRVRTRMDRGHEGRELGRVPGNFV